MSELTKEFEDLKKKRNWFLLFGVLLIVLGITSVSLPFIITTIAVEVVFGLLVVIAGIIQISAALFCQNWKGFFAHLLAGIIACSIGGILLIHPLEGIILLSTWIAIFFIIEGIAKIIYSLKMRPVKSWGWILFNGIISLLLGVLICLKLPFSGIWAIGLLTAINMLFGGLALTMFSFALQDK